MDFKIMENAVSSLKALKLFVNGQFVNKEPWQIVSITASTVLAGVWFWDFVNQPESVSSRCKKTFFKIGRKLPFIKQQIQQELDKVSKSFEKDAAERAGDLPYINNLNEKGKSPNEILELTQTYLELGDYKWKEGFVSGAVYFYDNDLIELLTKVYGLASYTNPLHSDIFPGICKMEAEIVKMCANLFHGTSDACGTMTTGGTESIMMACKAYRDYAREVKGITKPEMIIPRTAHPAFEKAAAYFKIAIRYIEVDPVTTTVSLKKMKAAINGNTIMLVGSVPNYPYGTMDDMQGIAAMGVRYNIPVHADCCLGGFLTAFMSRAGYTIPSFDFQVPGITSISADTHKYGFAPKGSSVVLYSHPKYRHYQYCVTTDWPGGVYGSPTVNGSRAGGIIAACWATLMYFGFEGYINATRKILSTTKYMEEQLRKVDGLYIFGNPVTSVIALGSNSFHIYRLSEYLSDKGWNLNTLQYPSGIHICVTYMHTMDGVADRFIQDVKDSVQEIMKNPELQAEGKMAIYGKAAAIPDRTIVDDFTRLYIDSMYCIPSSDKQVTQNGHN